MASLSDSVAKRWGVHVDALLPALALPLCVCLLGPWWSVYQFHLNEGINLAKAALVANGYRLYDPIWNDQPPVLTLILAAAHLLFPFNVAVARAIALVFGSLLLWALFRIVRRTDGPAAAWVVVVVLGTANLFLTLTVSVMIDLPAIAVAVCAIDQAMVGASERKPLRYLLAGLLFGLSLQIKMFTALMLPSLACVVLFAPQPLAQADTRRGRGVALTLGAAIVTFFGLAVAMGEPLIAELIAPHLITTHQASDYYSEFQGWAHFGRLLAGEPVVLVFGIAGIVAALLRPRELWGPQLAPILWLCISLITYANHKPLFPHHIPMILVPMAWLCGSAIRMSLASVDASGVRGAWQNFLVAAVVAALIAVGAWRAPSFRNALIPESPIATARAKFTSEPSGESFVVTDIPMDAYRAGVLVPPELAVYSSKRWINGYLPAKLIISVIQERRPTQLMFNWLPIDPEVVRFLNNSSYVRVAWDPEPHYIRRDLIASSPGRAPAWPK